MKEKESYEVDDIVAKDFNDQVQDEQEMRAELILRYLPLVRGIARRCGVLGRADAVDIIQEGVVGLIQAVDRFDPCRGVQVSSFAYWWIRKAILTAAYARESDIQGTTGVSRVASSAVRHQGNEESHILDKVGESFWNRQVEANVSRPERDDRNGTTTCGMYSADAYRKRLLFHKSACQGLLTEIERWKFQEDEIDIRISILKALSALTDLERSVICLRYGLDGGTRAASVSEVSWSFGLSQERIRRLEESALYKLRNVSGQFGLRVLLSD